MSLEKIHLRKLLQIFDLVGGARTTVLRSDIRSELKKASGIGGKGGDFYVPFWTDAKTHVAGEGDLGVMTEARIANNEGRDRLYELLKSGFLSWWDEKRRWKNVPFEFLPQSVKAQYAVPGLGTVKVENLLALKVGDDSARIIYPYFSEDPALSPENARIGLWVLSQALTDYPLEDIRILDILRATSFGTNEYPLQGNEGDLFAARYGQALADWNELKKEY